MHSIADMGNISHAENSTDKASEEKSIYCYKGKSIATFLSEDGWYYSEVDFGRYCLSTGDFLTAEEAVEEAWNTIDQHIENLEILIKRHPKEGNEKF